MVHLRYASQMLPFEVIRPGHLLFVRNEETQSRLNLTSSRSFCDSHPSLFERALVSTGVWSHDLEHNLQILIVEANTHKNFHRGWASFLAPTQEVLPRFDTAGSPLAHERTKRVIGPRQGNERTRS